MDNYVKRGLVYQVSLLLALVSSGVVALDLEPELEWDACKVHQTDIRCRIDFAPPSCGNETRTVDGLCEVFSCQSRLAGSHKEVGYMRIRTYTPDPLTGVCLSYPRIPAFVQVLDLSYIWRENITKSSFENVSDLKSIRSLMLVLSGTLYMDESVLGNLSSLECVNIDHGISSLLRVQDGIRFLRRLLRVPTLKRLSARHCNLNANFVSNITTNLFSNLRSLWLSGSDFSAGGMNKETFVTFRHLKGLDLSQSGLNLETLFRSDSLESLDLSGNELKTCPLSFDQEKYRHIRPLCPNLSWVDLSKNQITSLWWRDSAPSQWCLPNLTFLDLRRNLIAVLNIKHISQFRSLKTLHMEFQSVDGIELLGSLASNSSVQELYLENCNQLRFDMESTLDNKRRFFEETPNVEKLVLDGSNLHLMKQEAFMSMFGHLSRLHTLSLSNTKLEFVSAAVFARFPDLAVLILRDNSITSIPDGCFDSLARLVHLDLSGNKIFTLTELTFSASLRRGLTYADLSRNPLACSCDLMWFRDWFFADRWLFNVSVSEYKCYHPELQLTEFTLNKQACLLSREACSMIIFSCTVLVTTFTLFTLLFRYRWHLRLVFYEAFRGQSGVRKWRLQHGRFDHDVFVSYASEDFDWIRHRLMPQLEDRLHLRLCIHDRQFIPGKNIVDNIADCVESSKKVMMVFSKNFVRSQWCQFELAYCLSHVMEHEDALIVVCLDNVTSLDIMTTAMMAVLKTTTYIQWVQQADAVRSFWGRLEMALNEIMDVDEHAM